MTTFTTEDRIVVEKDGSLTLNVEPIPFAGMVTIIDNKSDVEVVIKPDNLDGKGS